MPNWEVSNINPKEVTQPLVVASATYDTVDDYKIKIDGLYKSLKQVFKDTPKYIDKEVLSNSVLLQKNDLDKLSDQNLLNEANAAFREGKLTYVENVNKDTGVTLANLLDPKFRAALLKDGKDYISGNAAKILASIDQAQAQLETKQKYVDHIKDFHSKYEQITAVKPEVATSAASQASFSLEDTGVKVKHVHRGVFQKLKQLFGGSWSNFSDVGSKEVKEESASVSAKAHDIAKNVKGKFENAKELVGKKLHLSSSDDLENGDSANDLALTLHQNQVTVVDKVHLDHQMALQIVTGIAKAECNSEVQKFAAKTTDCLVNRPHVEISKINATKEECTQLLNKTAIIAENCAYIFPMKTIFDDAIKGAIINASTIHTNTVSQGMEFGATSIHQTVVKYFDAPSDVMDIDTPVVGESSTHTTV